MDDYHPERMRTKRIEKGLSLGGMAKQVDPSYGRQNAYYWETKKTPPKWSILRKIAAVLGVGVEYFFGDEISYSNTKEA